MPLKNGDKAPDFTLYSTDKKEVSLADYRGRNLLLLFFPFAFTGTCTKELCSVRDDISYYNTLNQEVVAVSVDSVHTLIRYKEDQKLNFTLLSDFNKEASLAYDCLNPAFSLNHRGVSKRSAFVIDREGIIRYAEVLENAGELPDFDAIKKTLDSLIA